MRVPAVHLAIAVDDLEAARSFYGRILGLAEGRASDHWIDWNFYGHQLVTHLIPRGTIPRRTPQTGVSEVDHHEVPIPHLGLLLDDHEFGELSARLRSAGVEFVIEPYLRFPGEPAEQWTMFLQDPAGNSLEFKSFRDDTMVFAR